MIFRVRIFMFCCQLARFLQSYRGRREASSVLDITTRLKGRCREHTIAFYIKKTKDFLNIINGC